LNGIDVIPEASSARSMRNVVLLAKNLERTASLFLSLELSGHDPGQAAVECYRFT